MSLAFRNIGISAEDPVELWPTEAVLTALERGCLGTGGGLRQRSLRTRGGPVARYVKETEEVPGPYGVSVLTADVFTGARRCAECAERSAVAADVTQLLADSGMTRAEFASAIAPSASRLST